MNFRRLFLATAALALIPFAAVAADVPSIAGKAKSENGDTAITEGKVEKGNVSFVENMNYSGQELRIVYTGTVVSADEIKFKRDVGGQGGEELTAKRQK